MTLYVSDTTILVTDDAMFKVDVALSPDELFMCHSIASPLSNAHILQQVQLDNTHTNEADVSFI